MAKSSHTSLKKSTVRPRKYSEIAVCSSLHVGIITMRFNFENSFA